MRTLFLFWIILIPWTSKAVLFQTSGLNEKAYEQYLLDHRKESPIDYFQKKVNQGNTFNEQLVESSDLKNYEDTLTLLNTPERPPITLYTLEFLKDFAERSLEFKKSRASIDLLCFANILLGTDSASCAAHEQSLESLKLKLPDYQTLMIEGVPFHLQKLKSVRLSPTQRYHFAILSNVRMPFHFTGTWDELLQQAQSQDFWVQGDCDSFRTHIEDLSLRLQSEVMFKNCIRPVQEAEESKPAKTWLQRNKKWVYLSGAFLVGAGIYAMKDKKIVIDRSGF